MFLIERNPSMCAVQELHLDRHEHEESRVQWTRRGWAFDSVVVVGATG